MTTETETLAHAARLIRTLNDIRAAYLQPGGWVAVGMLLSILDENEIHEVADWVARYSRDLEVRDGSTSGVREEVAASEGQSSSLQTLPPPLRYDSAEVDPPLAVAAESTVPFDHETDLPADYWETAQ